MKNDPHLAARDFWSDVKHPELDATVVYPRHCVLTSGPPCTIERRAPLIGEHNEEIYMVEFGFPRDKLILLKRAGII